MSSHHFVTVCVVCVLCAAHTPCSAHNEAVSGALRRDETYGDTVELISTDWSHNHQSDSPETTGGLQSHRLQSTENIRKIKDGKRTTPKKYVHSYSEEKASRVVPKADSSIEEPIQTVEIQERLGQIPERSQRDGDIKETHKSLVNGSRRRRNVNIDDKYFTKKLFEAYGDGTSLTIEGFEKLLKKLGLFRLLEQYEESDVKLHENRGNSPRDSGKNSEGTGNPGGLVDANSISTQQKCLNSRELLSTFSRESSHGVHGKSEKDDKLTNLPDWLFASVCPVLIYHLAGNTSSEREGCINPIDDYSPAVAETIDELFLINKRNEMIKSLEEDEENSRNMVQVWVYSTISIVIISLCGLLGVAVIPVMGKSYYHQLLQFLVALAIGTLCGDALIHLLPHAMMSPHSHSHEESENTKTALDFEAEHNLNMWKGLTAMIGLIIFFFTEKALAMIAEWRKHRQRKNKLPTRVRVMRESDGAKGNNVGEKLCKHKYSSYPYCYGEITTETRDNHHDHQHNDHERPSTIDEEKPLTSSCKIATKNLTYNRSDDIENSLKSVKTKLSNDDWGLDGDSGLNNVEKIGGLNCSTGMVVGTGDATDIPLNESESYTVIIREHENKHHGHTHSHGHVHAAPDSLSSVAWMVVMGDGLHNFTDGMAIGAAFAANIAGGFSTAIAVFCHELPHELGDFAVLLKAGMSSKQAVCYNLLSSVLCLFGMIIGVLLGAAPAATSWIFAAAAGMFIYIALVDMIPELSSSHTEEGGSQWQCVLQAFGLITGLGIMLVIALYEHDLKHIFSD